ncbi:MAG: EF-Tu/IF-2/RF-3 family GTPase [Candidatus Micrarchaeaceae archaeon]
MDIVVALPFDIELAKFIGKKGSENSITFYNRKLGKDVIVALMPDPEKLYATLQVLTIASQILISTKQLDRSLGEAIIASSLLGKRVLFTSDSDISKLLNGIEMRYEVVEQGNLLEKLLEGSAQQLGSSGTTRIDIDKAFDVKGIGVVVLGIVTRGTVKVHDTLYHSSGKTVSIRSIQSQDEDISEADAGTRVGLAIKGMDSEEIGKGDLFTSTLLSPAKSVTLAVKKSTLISEQISAGSIYGIGSNFSYSKATVESIENENVSFRLEKALNLEVNDICLLERQATPRIFAAGRVKSFA